MHDPENHPARNPETSGRGQRFVTNTTAVRPVRLDRLSDSALTWLKRALAGEGRDTASVSLVIRRALRRYESYVSPLTPTQLDAERLAVREMSQLPVPRKPDTTTRQTPN